MNKEEDIRPNKSEEFRRFEEFARNLVSVPKKEIDELEKKKKETKKGKN